MWAEKLNGIFSLLHIKIVNNFGIFPFFFSVFSLISNSIYSVIWKSVHELLFKTICSSSAQFLCRASHHQHCNTGQKRSTFACGSVNTPTLDLTSSIIRLADLSGDYLIYHRDKLRSWKSFWIIKRQTRLFRVLLTLLGADACVSTGANQSFWSYQNIEMNEVLVVQLQLVRHIFNFKKCLNWEFI